MLQDYFIAHYEQYSVEMLLQISSIPEFSQVTERLKACLEKTDWEILDWKSIFPYLHLFPTKIAKIVYQKLVQKLLHHIYNLQMEEAVNLCSKAEDLKRLTISDPQIDQINFLTISDPQIDQINSLMVFAKRAECTPLKDSLIDYVRKHKNDVQLACSLLAGPTVHAEFLEILYPGKPQTASRWIFPG